jgi:tetratricopeptide (TPR) repeat protein
MKTVPCMSSCRSLCRIASLALMMGGYMSIPTSGFAQTPAQASAAAERQLPPEMQTQLDKLQAGLKAAQAASDARAEAKALNGIGNVYFGISQYQRALDHYTQALTQARTAKDALQEVAALNGIGSCYGNQSQNGKALEMYQQALGPDPCGDIQHG